MAEDNFQAIIDTATEAATPTLVDEVGGSKIYWLPSAKNGNGQVLDLQEYQAAPRRRTGTVTVFDVASLLQVIKDNADEGDTSVYIDRNPMNPSVVAVMNGNGKTGPGWGDFRVCLVFRKTPQWLKWQKQDGQMVDQVAFAEFLEENMEDISEPAGAAMLEIATHLELIRTVNFRSGYKLQSGAYTFQHDQNDDIKAGQVAIPATFVLGIKPIFGMDSYKVPARLRWRVEGGRLRLGFKLQRTEDLMTTIVEAVLAKIEQGTTPEVTVLDGLPP